MLSKRKFIEFHICFLPGKSSVTEIVCEELLSQERFKNRIAVVSLDDFYLGLRTPEVSNPHRVSSENTQQ